MKHGSESNPESVPSQGLSTELWVGIRIAATDVSGYDRGATRCRVFSRLPMAGLYGSGMPDDGPCVAGSNEAKQAVENGP